jgi:multiple sugar transport system permease protein
MSYLLSAMVPVLLVFFIVLAFPLGYVLYLMLRAESLLDPEGSEFIGLGNFERLAQEQRFVDALVNSFVFSAVSMLVSIPLGILLALYLARLGRFVKLVRALVIVPMVLAPLVVGALFRFLLDSGGFMTWMASGVGVNLPPLLSVPFVSLVTVAAVDAWQWTPLVGIIIFAGIQALQPSVLEAARLDGANKFQELWFFILPQLRPLLTLVFLIRFMDSFREFDKVFIMTSGGPGTSSETLPVYLYRFAFQYLDMGYAAAVGFVMLLIVSVISVVIVRTFKATKGVAE